MKHKKIVFVCTGNTCRSPMAETALRAELKRRKIRWYTISSAGLRATAGAPMAQNARTVLKEMGLSPSETFQARLLTPKMVKEATAVICMTREQALSLGDLPNVTNMAVFAGHDIADPYGQSEEVYRLVLHTICECIPRIIDILDIGNET